MSLWLILIIVGVVMALLGLFVEAAQFLIWLGIIILVVGLVLTLLNRSKT